MCATASPEVVIVVARGGTRDVPPTTFTVGQLAADLGVTTRTLRFYEEAGIVSPARSASGAARVYDARDRARLDELGPPATSPRSRTPTSPSTGATGPGSGRVARGAVARGGPAPSRTAPTSPASGAKSR